MNMSPACSPAANLLLEKGFIRNPPRGTYALWRQPLGRELKDNKNTQHLASSVHSSGSNIGAKRRAGAVNNYKPVRGATTDRRGRRAGSECDRETTNVLDAYLGRNAHMMAGVRGPGCVCECGLKETGAGTRQTRRLLLTFHRFLCPCVRHFRTVARVCFDFLSLPSLELLKNCYPFPPALSRQDLRVTEIKMCEKGCPSC